MRPFEDIVAAHSSTVLRVCRSILDFHDAEDAWSETFLAALQAYPRLGVDANVEAWLVTIAKRKAIDIVRARSRTAQPLAELPDAPGTLGIPGSSELQVWQAVSVLPHKQRACVALHHLFGMPHSEVAAVVGGSSDAARRAAADGLANLRRAFSTGTGE